MGRVYEAENGNTIYKNDDGTFSGYINDDSDTEEKFNDLQSAVNWADVTKEW